MWSIDLKKFGVDVDWDGASLDKVILSSPRTMASIFPNGFSIEKLKIIQ
jgi:hypothetical protein